MDNLIGSILADKTSYQLLWLLVLNLSFAVVELVYGLWANSLGLISDSFHMFFDCTALLAGLVAAVISHWEANAFYTFGYVRAEILAGFVNGICLLFVAFFIFSEAVERALDPPMVRQERLLAVSIAGFLVNVVGIFVFHHSHSHEPGSVCPSRLSVTRRHSLTASNQIQKSATGVPSVCDDSITVLGHSKKNISRASSDHENSYTDQEPSRRNTGYPSSDHAPSHTDQEWSQRDMRPIYADLEWSERDMRPVYTDQEWSERDTSLDYTDQEQSSSKGRDRSHSDHSQGGLMNAPTGLRRASSGQNRPATQVNSIVYQDTSSLNTTSSSSQIVQGVYLHILADALASVGVIVSSFLIHRFGWVIADPICSMFISALVVISVVPLLQESACILMQRTPILLDHLLPHCYNKVSCIEGVCNIQQPHFWTLCTDTYVGALKLEVASSADSGYILSQTQDIFREVGVKYLYVQIEQAPA